MVAPIGMPTSAAISATAFFSSVTKRPQPGTASYKLARAPRIITPEGSDQSLDTKNKLRNLSTYTSKQTLNSRVQYPKPYHSSRQPQTENCRQGSATPSHCPALGPWPSRDSSSSISRSSGSKVSRSSRSTTTRRDWWAFNHHSHSSSAPS